MSTAQSIYEGLYQDNAPLVTAIRQRIIDSVASIDAYSRSSVGGYVVLGSGHSSEVCIEEFNHATNPALGLRGVMAATTACPPERLGQGDRPDIPPSLPQMTVSDMLGDSTSRSRLEGWGAVGESALSLLLSLRGGVFAVSPSAQGGPGARVSSEPAVVSTVLCLLHMRLTGARPPAVDNKKTSGTVTALLSWTSAFRSAMSEGRLKTASDFHVLRSRFLNPAIPCAFCSSTDIALHAEPVTNSTLCGPCSEMARAVHWALATGPLFAGGEVGDVVEVVRGMISLSRLLTKAGVRDYRQSDITEEAVSNFLDEAFPDLEDDGSLLVPNARSIMAAHISTSVGGHVLEPLVGCLLAGEEYGQADSGTSTRAATVVDELDQIMKDVESYIPTTNPFAAPLDDPVGDVESCIPTTNPFAAPLGDNVLGTRTSPLEGTNEPATKIRG